MRNEFSSTDICQALNIPAGRFREWIVKNFVKPSIKEASGPGRPAVFSRLDVYGISIFHKLLKFGVNREQASRIAKSFLWEGYSKHILSIKGDTRLIGSVSYYESEKNDPQLVYSISPIRRDQMHHKNPVPIIYDDDVKTKDIDKAWEWDNMLSINITKIVNEVDAVLTE